MVLYNFVYATLTRLSTNLEKDWLLRLVISGLAMTIPFFVTLALAVQEGRQHALTGASKIGLLIATLSLGLTFQPVHDAILRAKQIRNLAMSDVAAPLFATTDISGNRQKLADHRGEVVLVNIWATWCGPCRAEIPQLDELYRSRKDKGLIVLGISDESVEVQRKFLQQVPASYPFLTLNGDVPGMYRDIAQYPAIFLIDRTGYRALRDNQPLELTPKLLDLLLHLLDHAGELVTKEALLDALWPAANVTENALAPTVFPSLLQIENELVAMAAAMLPARAQVVSPYAIDIPAWFTESLLELRDEVRDAAAQKKRVMLYFGQDGCPYCTALMQTNFSQRAIVERRRNAILSPSPSTSGETARSLGWTGVA